MKKILFIEDDPTVLKVLQSRLARENIAVIVAIDSDEGIRKAQTEHPDLVVLDIVMKGKSGLDVLSAIRREIKGGDKMSVVVFTTDDRKETREKSEALGVDDYLLKGMVSLEEVTMRIKNILEATSSHHDTEKRTS